MTDEVIGTRMFVDGEERPIYRRTDGSQHVMDNGHEIDGVWIWRQEDDVQL
jgi:hypothetical protein